MRRIYTVLVVLLVFVNSFLLPGQIREQLTVNPQSISIIKKENRVLHVVSRQKAIRSLELLDATGRCILQHRVDNAQHVELPESSPAGFSLIRCVFSDGSHAVVKCIKH